MNEKYTKWLIFGVLLALIPLLFGWLCRMLFGQNAGLEDLLSKGELLIISVGLCAGGVGELFVSSKINKNYKLISGGFALVILILSALTFAIISSPNLLQSPPDTAVVKWTSIIIYACALLSTCSCISLSE